MSVVLFGASPWGTRALSRLGVGYHLVVPPDESLSHLHGEPLSVTRLPFLAEPEAALAAPCPSDARASVSFTERGLLPAALHAALHGLTGTPVTGVALTRNKLAMRTALLGRVRQPRFGQVGVDPVPSDLRSVVVKPQSGTAGLGVALVSAADLDQQPGDARLWEELVAGQEYSVETVSRTAGGRLRIEVVGITTKATSGPPDFVEIGHTAPSVLEDAARDALLATVTDALECLGVTRGAAHTEVVLHPDHGPTLIEVQTRPGGGRIPSLHELVTGVDHYEATLRSLLDLPPCLQHDGAAFASARMVLSAPVQAVASTRPLMRTVDPTSAAVLVDVEHWPSTPRQPGQTRSNLDRHGVVVAAGNDPDGVARILDQTVAGLVAATDTHEEIPA